MEWPRIRAGVLKRARLLAALCVAGLLLPPFAVLFKDAVAYVGAVPFWLLDLGAHWQLLYVAGLAACLGVMLIASRNPRWAAGFALCGLPWMTAVPQADHAATASTDVFTVASANVYLDNSNSGPLAKWLALRRPDAVAVIEVTAQYGKQLEQLSDYPHRKIMPSDTPFGIAVLSRHPFESIEERATEDGIPYIRAVIDWKGRKVALTALHPMPPISADFTLRRDLLLHDEAQKLAQMETPGMIVGDLNATPWSTAFRAPAALGFKTAGSPLGPTWPSVLRGVMGIRIDHILVSKHWRVVAAEVGPDIGSDHFPVLAALKLAQ